MDIIEAILYMHPTAQFVMVDKNYDTMRWDSPEIPKPSFEEIQAVIASYVPPLPA